MNRSRRPLVALAMLALISTGCASSGGPVDANSNTSNRDQAVQFAECMRSNGVGAFPDPDASGQLTVDGVVNGSSVDPDSAAFTQAIGACKDLQPPGFTGHERNAQEQEDALKFAQCIREHGVKDFPDPSPDGPLVDTNRIPSAANGDLSVLNAAMEKCGDFIAGALGGQ